VSWAATAALPPSPHVIFADPPYHHDFAQKTLNALASNPSVPPDTLLVLQHGKRDHVAPVENTATAPVRTQKYGETIVQFFTLNP
jgi:16S rRNA G966 N2-methylase RsmD